VIDAREQDVRERIGGITGAGVDDVVETTGRPEMDALAAEVLAPLGTAGLLGTPKPGVKIPREPLPLMLGGRSVRGVVQGDAIPQLFIPRLIQMYRAGAFPFDRLVRFYDFDQINRPSPTLRAARSSNPSFASRRRNPERRACPCQQSSKRSCRLRGGRVAELPCTGSVAGGWIPVNTRKASTRQRAR
jgi:hypothetical protein